MTLDLVTMRAYVIHSLTVRDEMSVYLLTYLLTLQPPCTASGSRAGK